MDPDHHPKLSPVRAFQALHGNTDPEEQYTSLSEYHDYEPSLEFDDSELIQAGGLAPLPPELLDLSEEYMHGRDGTIEENFEEELAKAPTVYHEISGSQDEDSFLALNTSGLVEVVGDDEQGRRVIVISACRLPSNQILNPDVLLEYLMLTLDKFVEQDYSVVYFHYGLTSANKLPLSWLWKAYKAFDRKYKKNLKALYLVHPTNLIRIVWQMLRPAISVKFGKKMQYVNYLHELAQFIPLNMLVIPTAVLEHDKQLASRNTRAFEAAGKAGKGKKKYRYMPPITTQFGVSLQFIRDYNVNTVDAIPPVVRTCVDYLSQPDAIETEGIFRRSANMAVIRELIRACNAGEELDFNGDPHSAAVLLKNFLRDLDEPVMTFELYDEVMSFPSWRHHERARRTKILVLEKLPPDNYKLLKYIIKFLWKVQDRSCLNKMTVNNLAVVFGPNLSWGQNGPITLQTIGPVNAFTDFLLENQEQIFII